MRKKAPLIVCALCVAAFLALWLAVDLFVIPSCWRCFFLFAGPLFLQIISIALVMATLWSIFGWWKEADKSDTSRDEIQLMNMDSDVSLQSGEEEESTDDISLESSSIESGTFTKRKPLGKVRICIFLATAFAGLLLFATVIGYSVVFGSTVPPIDGQFVVHGITAPVSIVRDPKGIIHIEARSDKDLVFGQAWAHCQDRLWQMEFQRRLGKGRLSEILGEAAIEMDKLMLTLGLYRAANSSVALLEPQTLEILQAYCDGVNSYLNSNLPIPVEFKLLGFRPQPWTVPDILVWGKVMFLELSGNMYNEIRRYRWLTKFNLSVDRILELEPLYPEDGPTVIQSVDIANTTLETSTPLSRTKFIELLREEAQRVQEYVKKYIARQSNAKSLLQQSEDTKPSSFELLDKILSTKTIKRASNNWVISGSHTATGKPILANDPHLTLTAPSIWTLMHLKSDNIDVIGSSLIGVPGVIIGRTKQFAWGVTTVGTDVQDIFLIDEVDEGGYMYKNQYVPYTIRTEEIPLANGKTITLDIKETVYGPVINHLHTNLPGVLSLRSTLMFNDTTVEAFWRLNRATNWDEFRNALSYYTGPAQNFIYADIHGNIGYQMPALTPIRAAKHSGVLPTLGNGEYDWTGFVPFDEMLHAKNPREGFILSANNKAPPSNYKHLILNDLDWEFHYRAQRIRQMILEMSNTTKLSMDDIRRIQLDVKSLLFEDFKPILMQLTGLSNRAGKWQKQLLSWDGKATVESQEALMFMTWYTELTRLAAHELNVTYYDNPYYIKQALSKGTDKNCDAYGDCATFARKAFETAVDKWHSDPGVASMPSLGDEHYVFTEHLVFGKTILSCLFGRSIAIGGDQYTVNVAHKSDPSKPIVTDGPSYRHIIDLNNMENSLFIHPMGQSGNILSKHYDDLSELWQRGEYLPMQTTSYSRAATYTLQPVR